MSVIMTLSMQGDPAALERYATANEGAMREIVDHAAEHGLIAHRFYGSDDGWIMVVDEWPDEQSFQEFFSHMQPQVARLLEAAGVTAEPQTRFWRKLDTRDDHGWE